MKVALICRNFNKNSGQGIYKIAEYLYENLKKYSNLEIEKIESENKNPYFFDLIECPRKVWSSDVDIYHFLMPEVCLPALLSKQVREKSVATIHDTIVYKIRERKWLSAKYIKLMYNIAKNAKIIHTPSFQGKSDIIKFLRVDKEKIKVIPWSVDLEFFRPFRKKEKNKALTAGYLGGLGKRKNVEWIIKVAKKFENSIIFKIAGVGPRLIPLKKLTQKLEAKNVEFVGFIPEKDLPEFYNSLDIFIFPSLYEGFGVPLLEAIACEVPYIIGTNAGIGEILPIYKINSFKQLEEILKKIKERKLEPLKNQRRWIIENRLTWKENVNKLIEVYKSV